MEPVSTSNFTLKSFMIASMNKYSSFSSLSAYSCLICRIVILSIIPTFISFTFRSLIWVILYAAVHHSLILKAILLHMSSLLANMAAHYCRIRFIVISLFYFHLQILSSLFGYPGLSLIVKCLYLLFQPSLVALLPHITLAFI